MLYTLLLNSDGLTHCISIVRPPLSKTLFPVSRVGKEKASREVGNLFFPNFIFYKLECTGRGGGEVKKKESEDPCDHQDTFWFPFNIVLFCHYILSSMMFKIPYNFVKPETLY